MTAAQTATLKRLAQAAYELDAFRLNLTHTEADRRIAGHVRGAWSEKVRA